MLIYPPGKLYQRGEDRSQGNIDDSSATSMRASNDLGYAAAVLLKDGYEVLLKDYQTERLTLDNLLRDIKVFSPDLLMLSVTNSTIFDDLEVAAQVANQNMTIILKGAIFYNATPDMLSMLDLIHIDYLCGGEIEYSIARIADFALRGIGAREEIPNVFYKREDGSFAKTFFDSWEHDLDSIPFPARRLMNNTLYVRPDTNEMMATIQTSRGCSAQCIYCLSPDISGKNVRYRSVANVMSELEECYRLYGIRNFFFKSDTFTLDAGWVKNLCEHIITSPLHKKIAFAANSRTHPLRRETLEYMKRAGCFMVAFGFESGSTETMRRIKKGATIEHNRQAALWCKQLRLPFYGFFMIGFPWETPTHLKQTREHIFECKPDFIEIHMALPYYGTELYEMCRDHGTLAGGTLGNDYFNSNINGTQNCSVKELIKFRRDTMRIFYTRPSYLAQRLAECLRSPKIIASYARYGLRLWQKNRNS